MSNQHDREIRGSEAAAILRISSPTVTRMAEAGTLPVARRVGVRRDRRFLLSEVLRRKAIDEGVEPSTIDVAKLLEEHHRTTTDT